MGSSPWNKSSQALSNATDWAVTHGEQQLASLGNDAVSVGSTLLQTGNGTLHTLASAGGTAVNNLESATSTAVHYAEPWNWGL